MTTTSSGAKLMPVLGLLLILALGGALALVLLSGQMPAGPAPADAGDQAVVQAQSALARARLALDGNADAWAELPEIATQVKQARRQLPADPSRTAQQLATNLENLAGSGNAVRDVQRAADDLDLLATELTQRVYSLEGAIVLQREPVVTAQLERLRLLGDGARRDVRSLASGADPAPLSQPLLDAEIGLERIVRGLREGDAELGLRAVEDPAAIDTLDAVSGTVGAIADKIRDALAPAETLATAGRTRAQLDEVSAALAARAESIGGGQAAAGSAGSLPAWLLPALLGVALLAFVLLAILYLRSAGLRRSAQLQAEQTERNQRAIMRLLDELGSLADGDLTVTATVTEDITGAIADSINYAIEALRELVTTVNDSAILVDGAAKQTDTTAQQLAEATATQSKQIQAASEAIARMASSIEEVSGNAERSADVARHSVDVAHKGGDAVRRTIAGMNAIRETIQETSKRIKRLGESSQEIGNIVELINDIADQTNILALNASIQASMAGEAGRGFAVVADEVQRLAERSTNATKQIEVLVRTIQADTNEAVVSMERSTTDVVGGALLAENAGAALEEIEQVSNQIASLVQNISESSREQSKAADAVTRNTDVLQEINSQTASSTAETTDSIRKLAELASQLRESVSGFRLPTPGEEPDSSGVYVTDDSNDPVEASGDVDGTLAEKVRFVGQKTA
jgi:twitching motility protein PilJ